MEMLHPEDVNDLLPEDIQKEDDIRFEMQKLVVGEKKINPEPPKASPHCLLRFGRGRDGSCFIEVHRDPVRGVGKDFLKALEDLRAKIVELLPKLEMAPDAFSRLVRTSILREVLRTFDLNAF